jgi:acyl carrier protein
MLPFLKDLSLHSVQLDIVMDQCDVQMKSYLDAVAGFAEAKKISPIVDKVFPAREIESAFRYMMAGTHKGKIVIDFAADVSKLPPQEIIRRPLFSADTTLYIISGGLGALGWLTWQWLAMNEGATRFLLLSRSGSSQMTPQMKADIERLRFSHGAEVAIAKCDVANESEVQSAYELAMQTLSSAPKRIGILHMAMSLHDAPIAQMTENQFGLATKCKIDGAKNLMGLLKSPQDLEFSLFFSSISSVFGNHDQANYAAGNSFLDSYCTELRAKGFSRTHVINLSGVDDVGVLADDFRLRMISLHRGLKAGLTARMVLEEVRVILSQPEKPQWVFGDFVFKDLCSNFPCLAKQCDHLIDYRIAISSSNDASSSEDVASSLSTIESMTAAVARLFAIDPKLMDVSAPLTEYGLDSLLAVELSATLKNSFGVKVTQMELLGGLSLEKISARSLSS